MFEYEGKKYYTPQELNKMYRIPIPTLYHWSYTAKVEMADLVAICAPTPFEPIDLKSSIYFEYESAMKAIRELRHGKRSHGNCGDNVKERRLETE